LQGKLSDTSGVELAKAGAGTLILSGDNSAYTGPITVIDNSGVLEITTATALGGGAKGTTVGANSQLAVSSSSPLIINEPLILNGPGVGNNGALYNLAGDNTWAGNIELDSDATVGGA